MNGRNGRRVVVTGMGAVTPLGNDVATFWGNLVAGKSGVRVIEAWDPQRVTSKIAGEVRDFDPSGVLDRKEVRRNDRYTQFMLVAAHEAMASAGLPERLEGQLADETGAIIGSGMGGTGTLTEQITINATRGPDRLSPFFIPMAISNIGSGQVAISFGMKGPNFATISACATAGHAIGELAETILRGDAEVMLTGGSEAPIFEPFVGAFASMRALSTRNEIQRARRARSTKVATASSLPKAAACSSSRNSPMPSGVAPTSWPSSWATARQPMRATSRCPLPVARAARRPLAAR